MTIAIVVKVGDALVLGADSAATLGGGQSIANVYFNAEKLFNLVKGLPIGVAVAGLGGLAGRSVSSLARDLRAKILAAPVGDPWRLDKDTYTIEQAANLVRKFFYEEHYCVEYGNAPAGTDRPSMSMIVSGYSANAAHSEVWIVEVGSNGQCVAPVCQFAQNQTGVATWRGMPEAVNRLVNGWSTGVAQRLVDAGVPEAEVMPLLSSAQNVPLIHPAMPLQDAIDLVQFLIETTVGFVRFAPGAPTVAPPIDLAAITKHEHFRWVRRKHYFTSELNRPIDRHPLT